MNKHLFLFLFLAMLVCPVSAQTIRIHPEKEIAKISPLFWGVNFLNWIEDDEALQDGKILRQLKEMPCRLLRYPGGTIADNFNWKTSTLENPNMFPYESGEPESNFDEFMRFCTSVGAEPLLVVNTQSWFLKDKVEEGAQYAADWVKYCMEKGYHVKYWEIGNETYWHPFMTAREYGHLVNVYAAAMKKVNPDILISANFHWDIHMVGTKERTDSSQWRKIQEDFLSIASKEDYRRATEFADGLKAKDNNQGDKKWCNDVLSVCGDQIDLISVHWYYHKNVIGTIDTKINELKSFIQSKKPGKKYLYCLSEFNCNDAQTEDRVPGFAESLGRFLNTGFQLATFWPLRIKGMEMRSMLTLDEKTPQYPYQIVHLFSKYLQGRMIECQSPELIYTFASKSNTQLTVVVSGRLLKETTDVSLEISSVELKSRKISAVEYRGASENKAIVLKNSPVVLTNQGGKLEFSLTPKSFVVLLIN